MAGGAASEREWTITVPRVSELEPGDDAKRSDHLVGNKTGGRLIRHARYFILQLAESQLTQRLFAQIIRRIERLAWHPT